VADASALVEYLLGMPQAAAIASVLEDSDTDVHVPALCDVEIAAALRKGLLSRRMSLGRAAAAVEDYLDLPLVRHGHGRLIAAILEKRANFSAYDAAYVALAEILSAALLSVDRRLLRATARHTVVRSAMAGG